MFIAQVSEMLLRSGGARCAFRRGEVFPSSEVRGIHYRLVPGDDAGGGGPTSIFGGDVWGCGPLLVELLFELEFELVAGALVFVPGKLLFCSGLVFWLRLLFAGGNAPF